MMLFFMHNDHELTNASTWLSRHSLGGHSVGDGTAADEAHVHPTVLTGYVARCCQRRGYHLLCFSCGRFCSQNSTKQLMTTPLQNNSKTMTDFALLTQ
jgi:hypothetical protein